MVASYHGTSTYLLMVKYNNYASVGGDGVNKLAILDPNDTQIDPVTGQSVMKEVLTIAGVTPDAEFVNNGFPNAVREWCINTAVVDPATKSVLVNSEDGKLYRWDLTTNSFSEVITLTLWDSMDAVRGTCAGARIRMSITNVRALTTNSTS